MILLVKLRWAVLAALVATALPVGPARASTLELVGQTTVSARVRDLTFRTPALKTLAPVRVVLPAGYDASGATRYPVLFLLHGGAGNYRDWSTGGDIEALTAGLPLITVMPDAGRSAWYTDWHNNGQGGPPMWETFHIGQLLPWIDEHFPTVGDRSGRAIAGLSSGGFGAMSYASRHPDLFVAAAAFSGAVDTNTPPVVAGKVIDLFSLQEAAPPGSMFGIRELEEVRWRGHNPWDLATNLRATDVTLRSGNGNAGGTFGGGGPSDPAGYFLESSCYRQSVSFHQRLDALGIGHVWDDYGPGTHNYAYWKRSLERTLPQLMAVFAEHRAAPSPFSYRSIEPAYDIYGWSVAFSRPVLEFSALDAASAQGFRLSGSGAATVTTAALFVPGDAYRVTVNGVAATVNADGAGRLRIGVSLGAANPLQQQFLPDGTSPLTTVRTAIVQITPA